MDMLCINQGNIDERSSQVRFMMHIFASAESSSRNLASAASLGEAQQVII